MVFFTGANSLPPGGFERKPTMSFIYAKLATSSTCNLQLRLPIIHNTYNAFKDAFTLSIKGNDGFGGV